MASPNSSAKLSPYQIRPESLSKDGQQCPQVDHYPPLVATALDLISRLDGYSAIIAKVQLYAGVRAIEVLSLRHSDVSPDGFVFFSARKRSVDRVCYCPCLLVLRSSRLESSDKLIFKHFGYKKYYRTLLAVGGAQFPRTKERLLISNLFRRASALLAHQLGHKNLAVVAEFLGHKSINSSKFYLEKRK